MQIWLLKGIQWCFSRNVDDAAALLVHGCTSLFQAALLTSIRLSEHASTGISIKKPEEFYDDHL